MIERIAMRAATPAMYPHLPDAGSLLGVRQGVWYMHPHTLWRVHRELIVKKAPGRHRMRARRQFLDGPKASAS